MPTWWSAVPKVSPHPQQCGCRLQGRRWWDLASESKTIQGQDRRKRIAFGGLWKGRLKSISSRFRETPPAGRPTNCEPSGAGRSWKGGARERADDVFFAKGIKRRRSKADFAPTWKGRLKSILSRRACGRRTWEFCGRSDAVSYSSEQTLKQIALEINNLV